MADPSQQRSAGRVFNAIATQYERHRPLYPEALLDQAWEVAGLRPRSEVLEVGCGTGQLTRRLLARGVRVTAVEPGDQLIAAARAQLHDPTTVRFVHAPLEEAPLPAGRFTAAFAASSIHWVDPDVSWQALAHALTDGGALALLSYFGLSEPWSAEDQQAVRAAMASVAPALAEDLPVARDLETTRGGVEQRRENVSEVWAWLGSYDVARPGAAQWFDDVRIATVTRRFEHTADELNALLATMSFWARLSPREREDLIAENRRLHDRLGRPIRSSTLACLVTARRRQAGAHVSSAPLT